MVCWPSKGDHYALQESIWEAALFIGLDCIGWDLSIFTFLGVILNLVVQVSFTYFCFIDMAVNPLDGDTLTSLLKFRAGIGHGVAYADKLTERSMVRQLCDEDNSMHMAENQLGFR